LKNIQHPINDSNKKSVPIGNQMNSRTSDIDDPAALGQLSFVNGSDTKIESRDDLTPKEQVVLMISNDCLPLKILFPLFRKKSVRFPCCHLTSVVVLSLKKKKRKKIVWYLKEQCIVISRP
jgi:hypothetical protein